MAKKDILVLEWSRKKLIWVYYEKHKSVLQICKILKNVHGKVRNAFGFYKKYGTFWQNITF